MIRRPFLSALIGLAVAAGPLLSQTDDLARLRAEFGEVYTARISAAIESGVRDGIPRSLLVDKAVEGAAKEMEPEVVLAAVRNLVDELRYALEIVGSDASPETLTKTADAVRHGVERDVLIALRRDHPDEYVIMLVAIEDLLHAGVPLDVAQTVMLDAASRGLSGQDVLVVSATVRRLVREGSAPGQAASSVLSRMRSGRPPVPQALPSGPLRGTLGARRGRPPIPPF